MIAVCGEALVDEIHLADGTVRVAPGGGPFNTARAVARLGVPAAFVGHLSKDEQGRDLAQLLGSDGVSLEYATFGPERTTVAVATLDVKGHAVYRFDVEGTSAPNLTPEMLPVHFAADVAALHVGSLGLVMEPMASTLVELVRREREGRLVMVDPNVRAGLVPDPVYRRRLREVIAWSSVVKASAEDLAWLYPDVDHRHAARNLAADGVALVVVTLGAGGAYGVHHEDEVGVAAKPVDVVDTVGAGDAFGAALLAWLHDHSGLSVPLRLERAQLLEALGFACAAAAVTCSRAGADPPWKRELVVS